MDSFNQQSNACPQPWAMQPNNWGNTNMFSRAQYLPTQNNFVPQQFCPQQRYPNSSYNQTSAQLHQAPVQLTPFVQPAIHNTILNPDFNAHHASISMVPTSYGGCRAIPKRKRKRTMFTTELVEALEMVFQRKSYVTREERRAIVEELNLTDVAVKVWFQNRRLRGKRAAEEAAQEAAELPRYEEYVQEQSSCTSESSDSVSSDMSRLDAIESKLMEKVDASGFLRLDEEAVATIVSVVDSFLSPNISLDLESPQSYYEPVSPCPVGSHVETEVRWSPLPPRQSLQNLFAPQLY